MIVLTATVSSNPTSLGIVATYTHPKFPIPICFLVLIKALSFSHAECLRETLKNAQATQFIGYYAIMGAFAYYMAEFIP